MSTSNPDDREAQGPRTRATVSMSEGITPVVVADAGVSPNTLR
jgi:hypothetical protein